MIGATDSTRGSLGLSAARELLRRCCTGQCAGDGHACDRTPSPDFPELHHPDELDPAGPLARDVQEAIGRVTSAPAGALAETSASGGEVPVRVIAGTPDDGRLAAVLQRVFHAARQEILVTNPYLVPPRPLLEALAGAARRGVTVHLLVPGRNNHPIAGLASAHLQGGLLRAGVRVSRWSGPMLHAKTVVVDRRWSLVGSSNLDTLSLRRNAELDVAVHGPAFGEQMARLFERDRSLSEPYRLADWESSSPVRHWGRRPAATLSPWL